MIINKCVQSYKTGFKSSYNKSDIKMKYINFSSKFHLYFQHNNQFVKYIFSSPCWQGFEYTELLTSQRGNPTLTKIGMSRV